MRIAVCIKSALYSGLPLVVDPTSGQVRVKHGELVYTPGRSDLSALEEALRLKRVFGCEVVAVTLGPKRAAEAVWTCVARGADQGVHLLDEDNLAGDPYHLGLALSLYLAELHCALILLGARSSDEGGAQIPSIIAELLDLPQVTSAIKIEPNPKEKTVRATRRLERGRRQVLACPLPAVLSVEADVSELHYVSVRSIEEAAQKGMITRPVSSLISQPELLVNIIKLIPPRPRPKKLAKPDTALAAAQRLQFLLTAGLDNKEDKIVLEGESDDTIRRLVDILVQQGVISNT